jgi:hypothetical protein
MQQLTAFALSLLLLTAFAAVAAAKCPLGDLAQFDAVGEAVWPGRLLLQQNRSTVRRLREGLSSSTALGNTGVQP